MVGLLRIAEHQNAKHLKPDPVTLEQNVECPLIVSLAADARTGSRP
jgi:hypothetical protein